MMTTRKSSGELLNAQATIVEDRILEAMRTMISEQQIPRPVNWKQLILGWLVAPVLGIAAFVFTQQLAFRQAQDKLAEHDKHFDLIENHLKDTDAKADKTRERIEDKLDKLTQLVVAKEHK